MNTLDPNIIESSKIVLENPVGIRLVSNPDGTTTLQTAHIVDGPGLVRTTEWVDVPVVKESELPPQA